jgi:hypothetical protein
MGECFFLGRRERVAGYSILMFRGAGDGFADLVEVGVRQKGKPSSKGLLERVGGF